MLPAEEAAEISRTARPESTAIEPFAGPVDSQTQSADAPYWPKLDRRG